MALNLPFQNMSLLPNLLLFLITLAGGSLPLWFVALNEKRMNILLAFSGAFLLGITFLHLLPETFTELEHSTGFYLLAGFFLQLLIQRVTHGVEHGHVHHPDQHQHGHQLAFAPILTGLTVHAFMEGLPLGFHYREAGTQLSLYLAIGAHKLPEAMILATLALQLKGRTQAWLILCLFSAVTPLAAWLSITIGPKYYFLSALVPVLIAIVAGAFIHIATTIFFESGTRHHAITWQKILAMVLGAGIAISTLLIGHEH